jgi:hypothetical protein
LPIIGKSGDKDSGEIGVYDKGRLVRLGACTTIGKRVPAKPDGMVLDIDTLGFQRDGIRSAPWVDLRPDLKPNSITMTKLVRDLTQARKAALEG